jgi:hypothetical protein
MDLKIMDFENVQEAINAIEAVGASNSVMMGTRALHFNVLISGVPAAHARALKKAYNEVGAEAAISHAAYYEEECETTDVLAMGTLYQHREARRVLEDKPALSDIVRAVTAEVEKAPKAHYTSEDAPCACSCRRDKIKS